MPPLGKGAALCKVLAVGICGTDKHSYRGETVQYKGTENEIDLPFPIIQGHELAMEIVAIDEEGAKNLSYDGDYLKVGDRVTICPDVVCGECWFCENMPSYPWCEKAKFHYGHNRSTTEGKQLYGGFSQYMYIEPGARLCKIPDGLPNDMACFTEVMCVAYTPEKAREFSSFDLEGFNFGDTVVVQDCGAEIVVECVGRPEVFPEGLKYLRKAGMYLEQAEDAVKAGMIRESMKVIIDPWME